MVSARKAENAKRAKSEDGYESGSLETPPKKRAKTDAKASVAPAEPASEAIQDKAPDSVPTPAEPTGSALKALPVARYDFAKKCATIKLEGVQYSTNMIEADASGTLIATFKLASSTVKARVPGLWGGLHGVLSAETPQKESQAPSSARMFRDKAKDTQESKERQKASQKLKVNLCSYGHGNLTVH